jgi:hypothetical protein
LQIQVRLFEKFEVRGRDTPHLLQPVLWHFKFWLLKAVGRKNCDVFAVSNPSDPPLRSRNRRQ